MTRRPLCMLCLILMLSMCATDWAGIPLIRGNPLPENAASWIEEHPQATLCGDGSTAFPQKARRTYQRKS